MTLDSNNICLYFHYPFCTSKCPYCDFNSHVKENIDYNAFEKAYLEHISYFSQKLRKRKIKSIFFGGGTPSLMPISLVEKIIEKIYQCWTIANDCEITIECNPTSFEREKFYIFRNIGINRISVGVQSFDDKKLKFLGRGHSAKEAIYAIEKAANIFDNYSFDLMYALPDQDIKSWIMQLKLALSFNSKHLSLYQLTIEKGTKFYKDFLMKKFYMPDSDLAADFYNSTVSLMRHKGFNNYEISNFAQKGFASEHNLNYWQGGDYLGIGAGAHSRVYFDNSNLRRSLIMLHNPDKWLEISKNEKIHIQTNKIIKGYDLIKEIILTSLRLDSGLTQEIIDTHFDNLTIFDIFDKNRLEILAKEDLIYCDKSTLRINDKGRILTDSVILFLTDKLQK